MGIFTAINDAIGRNTWPPPGMGDKWEQIELYAALRSSNGDRLRQQASVSWRDPYMLSPVPRLVSRAKANLLFAEPPTFQAAAEQDQDELDFVASENVLDAELHRAAVIASSEGSTWGRVVVVPEVLDCPVIEFASPARVIPHFAGRFVRGATFVTEWRESTVEVVRLLESYLPGRIENRLYRGTTTALGGQIKLASYERTKGRQDVQETGLEWPLCAFIPNSIDDDPTWGVSDYRGLEDRFLALNESLTVGQANLRLAGRKRAIVDAGYLNDRGRLPSGDDIFIRESRHGGDTETAPKPLQVIEYSFESSAQIAWIDHLLDSTLSFGGIAPQSVGRGVDNGAISGTALKLKMSHSLVEAAGSGRHFDRGTTRLLRAAAVLDRRFFGRQWSKPDSLPSIERADALPRDDQEAAQQIAALVGSESISLEERLRYLHPQWTVDQIDDEAQAIRAENTLPSLAA